MERRLFIIIVFLGLRLCTIGSDRTITDSLIQEVNRSEISDSLRCVYLAHISGYHPVLDSALYFGQLSLQLAEEINEPLLISSAYHSLGNVHKSRGDLSLALDYFIKAAKIDEDHNLERLGLTYLDLGDIFARMGQDEKSFSYYRKAIDYYSHAENGTDSTMLASILINFGDNLTTANQLDSATFYTDEAIKLSHALHHQYLHSYAIGNKGLILAKLDKYDSAEILIDSASNYLKSVGDYYPISIYHDYLAQIYFEKQELDKAIQYAQSSYSISSKSGLKEQIRDASLKLYKLYREVGDYEKALNYHEEFLTYKDSIADRQTIQRIGDLRTEFEVGQKQAEVDVLTAERRTQRIVIISVVVVAVILLTLALIIFKYYQDRNKTAKLLAQQKSDLETLNQTKDKFFSIISHDLRGPVSSFMGVPYMIKHFVNSKETDQLLEVADHIDDSVRRLAALLDNLLKWAMQQQGQFPHNPEMVSLNEISEDLISTLKNMAEGKEIDLWADIKEPVNLWVDKNTTMTILRNLVSNSLKFTPEGGSVAIAVSTDHDRARLQISDTGVGMPKEKLKKLFSFEAKKSTFGTDGEKGLGLGLQLVREFVQMNGGSISVESEEGKGTTFTVELPLYKGTE